MKIQSMAHALPSQEVSNDDLIERIVQETGRQAPQGSPGGLRERLTDLLQYAGAATRYHRAPGERSFEFGVTAARRALAQADLTPEAIDLLIYVGVGRGFIEPATANVFQGALEMCNATCFDILDACASWLRGLDVAHHLIRGGGYRNAMIINCEFNFQEYIPLVVGSMDDLEHMWAGFTIGEAATATIVSGNQASGGYCSTFRSTGRRHGLCQIPLPHAEQFNGNNHHHPPLRFYAYAKPLHEHAITQLEQHYRSEERINRRQHDIIFGHSASAIASRRVLEKLELQRSKYVEIFPRFGNTVSASIPLAMSVALGDGRLQRGQRVLLIMGSAGLTTGFCSLEY